MADSAALLEAEIAIANADAAARIAAAVQAAQIAGIANNFAATAQADATVTASQNAANAVIKASSNDQSAAITSAQLAATAQTQTATIAGQDQVQVATIEANADTTVANTRATADTTVAQLQASAQTTSTTTQANAHVQAATQSATIAANADEDVAHTHANAEVQVAQIRAGADVTVSGNQLVGTEFSASTQLTGVEYVANQETARLNIALAFAQDKWDQIFPLIGPLLGSISQNPSGGSTNSFAGLLAALGAAPYIDQSGVWTPSQIQTQLNKIYARGDTKSQSDFYDAQVDLAGRGFGGSSPLLDILRFSYEAINIESSIEGANQIGLSSSQTNAEVLLKQQTEREEQFAASERAFWELEKAAVDLSTGVLQAVAAIIGATTR